MTAKPGLPLDKQKKPLGDVANSHMRHRGNNKTQKSKKRFPKKRKLSQKIGKDQRASKDRLFQWQLDSRRLPLDPMLWSSCDVAQWLTSIANRYSFKLNYNLFIMNGKGLCLMSLEGFRYRSPEGGALLYADLRRRLLDRFLLMTRYIVAH